MKNIHAKVSAGLLEQFYIKSSMRIYEKLGNRYLKFAKKKKKAAHGD